MKVEAYYLGLMDYGKALNLQKRLALLRKNEEVGDTLLLMEHNHVITIGRLGNRSEIRVKEKVLKDNGLEVYEVERGGATTYHGPGQLIGYPIWNLKAMKCSPISFLRKLEVSIIKMLNKYGVEAKAIQGKTGVWVDECKIASIGIHISRWVSIHGFAINACNDLKYFDLIVPCGIPGCKYTSLSLIKGTNIAPINLLDSLISSLADVFNVNIEMKLWDEDKFFNYYAFSRVGYFY
jgi:lipoyl(octanoyl) transferase